jgi:hypothetical protein
MQTKLKLAFSALTFLAFALTVFAASQQPPAPAPNGGFDVSHFSPQMLSISAKVGQTTQADTLTPLPH